MNYIIDCGTHFGQGLEAVSRDFVADSFWNIFTFEANPITYKTFTDTYFDKLKIRFPKLVSENLAVHTYDGEIFINIEVAQNGEGETGQGSSIIGLDKWKPQGGKLIFKDEPFKIKCIDLDKFIANIESGSRIILKLDIEGAEYDILEKMIETGTIKKLDHLIVEFHHKFFENSYEMKLREDKILQYIQNNSIKFTVWY